MRCKKMIYTNNTKKAINIAYEAHKNQKDKSGIPYILHPIHLAEQMTTEDECIVAMLHDVVEDTETTLDDLSKEFSKNIIDALSLLTHDKNVDYKDYIQAISKNSLATKVKIADLNHNLDYTRLPEIKEEDKKRIIKYEEALKILTNNHK